MASSKQKYELCPKCHFLVYELHEELLKNNKLEGEAAIAYEEALTDLIDKLRGCT